MPLHHRLFDAEKARLGPRADRGGAGGGGEGRDLADEFAGGDGRHRDPAPAVLDLDADLAFEDEIGPCAEVALAEEGLAREALSDGAACRDAGEIGLGDRGEARRGAEHADDAVRVARVDGSVHGMSPRRPGRPDGPIVAAEARGMNGLRARARNGVPLQRLREDLRPRPIFPVDGGRQAPAGEGEAG